MQLQLHLMHSYIESQLAVHLLPDPAHLQLCVQQQQQQQQEAEHRVRSMGGEAPHGKGLRNSPLGDDLSRALAAWRLSRSFLCQSSWNKNSFVVETEL